MINLKLQYKKSHLGSLQSILYKNFGASGHEYIFVATHLAQLRPSFID